MTKTSSTALFSSRFFLASDLIVSKSHPLPTWAIRGWCFPHAGLPSGNCAKPPLLWELGLAVRDAERINTRPWKASVSRLRRVCVPHQESLAGAREGWSNATSWEADRQVLSLPSLAGITLPVWLIPRGSWHVSLLQPNSLVPVSSSEAALSPCYISDWTCQQRLFSRGNNPSRVLAFRGDNILRHLCTPRRLHFGQEMRYDLKLKRFKGNFRKVTWNSFPFRGQGGVVLS